MIRIEKKQIYESHGYTFMNFVMLSEEEKLMILRWRNTEKVRQMMLNKELISEKEHFSFIDNLKKRNDCEYWLVSDRKGIKVGVVDLHHIDYEHSEADMGFYMDPSQELKLFEFMIECNYFMYVCIGLITNTITINVNNKYILLVNKFLGATFSKRVKIGDEDYYVGKVSMGKLFKENYDTLTLSRFAKFVKSQTC